jgi:hypothetical protein
LTPRLAVAAASVVLARRFDSSGTALDRRRVAIGFVFFVCDNAAHVTRPACSRGGVGDCRERLSARRVDLD